MLHMIREVHDSLSKPATASSPLLLNQCHKFFCISSLHDTNYRIFINICIYIYFNYIAAGILYFKPVCDFLCLNPGVQNKIYKYKYSAATRSGSLHCPAQTLLSSVSLSHHQHNKPHKLKFEVKSDFTVK